MNPQDTIPRPHHAHVSTAVGERMPQLDGLRTLAVALGRISYGFYLYHHFARWYITEHWPMHTGLAQFLVVGSISLVVSIISWHIVEKPFNSLKDRFAYEERGGAAVASARVLDTGAGRHAATAT